MARVWFDFAAATNGSGSSPNDPKNTLSGFTPVAGDELRFRRGTSYNGTLPLVNGLPGKRTKYSAWYHKDGSDDTSKSRPIFNLSAVLNTYGSTTNKDNIDIDSLHLSAPSLPVISDSYVLYLGHNSAIWNCKVDTNVGAIGAYGKSNVVIAYNEVSGVSYSGTAANNVIGHSDNKQVDNVLIEGNTVVHKGGGGDNCHGIRVDVTSTAVTITNVIIRGNTVSPPVGVEFTTNHKAIGIRLEKTNDAEVCYNEVKGMLTGLFLTGGGVATRIYSHHNRFHHNLNFGEHYTLDTDGCLIEYDDCSFNGTNIEETAMHAYGRGIEFSSSSGQNKCQNHVVRFCVLTGNKNYGGPLDNGSEGVGLGFDDGTRGCVAYGNIITDNEGDGIQYYGGPLGAGWTDTSNHAVANFLKDNGKAAYKNRRTGGTTKVLFGAHIGMSAVIGGQSVVANNVMVGGDCGIRQTSNCVNVSVTNNIFIDVTNAMSFGGAGYGVLVNVFYEKSKTIKKYSTTAVDANGAPTYATLTYAGSNDMTTNPQLDATYRPLPSSPVIGAGNSIGTAFLDFGGRRFKGPCSIGMYEDYVSNSVVPIRL